MVTLSAATYVLCMQLTELVCSKSASSSADRRLGRTFADVVFHLEVDGNQLAALNDEMRLHALKRLLVLEEVPSYECYDATARREGDT